MGEVRRGLKRGLMGVAVVATVLATVLAGVALQAGAETPRSAPHVVATKSKSKKKKPASACKLLTAAEITQALGTAPTEPPTTASADECDYSAPAFYNFLNISVRPIVTTALWNQSAQGAGATIPVTGIGDAAYRSPTNATIMVRKGKRTLRIDQYVPGLSEAAIESLGKAATARM